MILLKRLYPDLRERINDLLFAWYILIADSFVFSIRIDLISEKIWQHLMLSTLVLFLCCVRFSISTYKNRVHIWMQMIARAALSSQKMRCASRTWRVKTAVWSYGVIYSLSPPRGRKGTCPYTEHETGVYACLSAVHRRWGTHARKRRRRKRKFSWQSASVVTESDVRWSAARGAENHRHERRNLRSHHPCMQMPWPWGMPPPDLSLSSRPDYLRSLSCKQGTSHLIGSPTSSKFYWPAILQSIVD